MEVSHLVMAGLPSFSSFNPPLLSPDSSEEELCCVSSPLLTSRILKIKWSGDGPGQEKHSDGPPPGHLSGHLVNLLPKLSFFFDRSFRFSPFLNHGLSGILMNKKKSLSKISTLFKNQ